MLDVDAEVAAGAFTLALTLRAQSGQTVAVLGPNGSGKTTLLRALAGLTPIARGRITLDDDVLDDPETGIFVDAARRRVGAVFQHYALFPHLSALDNVAYGMRCRGLRAGPARAKARAWLARLNLEAAAGARPHELSGGQAQRVALARALAVEPALLLLDEPLAALDAQTRAAVRRELRRHLDGFEGVQILVTHDPIDALVLAHWLVIVEDGRITQAGTPRDVTAYPRSRYVAELAGTNLYRGTAGPDGIEVDGGDMIATDTELRGAVYAVVAPSAVAVHRSRPEGSPRNVWPGVLGHIEHLGSRARLRIEGPIPIVADVTAAAVEGLALRDGDNLWVAVKATEVQVYPA